MSDTPAAAALPVRHAGLFLRTVAGLVDLGVISLVACLVAWLLGLPLLVAADAGPQDTVAPHVFIAATLFLAWLYCAGMEASALQATPGMAVLGIFTADMTGGPAGFNRTSVRYWTRFVSIAIFLAGFLPVLFTKRRQALHDMLAGCTVLKR